MTVALLPNGTCWLVVGQFCVRLVVAGCTPSTDEPGACALGELDERAVLLAVVDLAVSVGVLELRLDALSSIGPVGGDVS